MIEDDERALEAFHFQLQTAGFAVACHPSSESFLESPESKDFDCIIADICLPKLNGLQLLAHMKKTSPFISIILITGRGDMTTGVEAMRQGAIDCFEKPIDDELLLRAIERGISISRAKRMEFVGGVELRERESRLTPREREVFSLITAGLLNKQVGAQLGPSEHTVKKHRARVMGKMGAQSLAELVRMAEVLKSQPGTKS